MDLQQPAEPMTTYHTPAQKMLHPYMNDTTFTQGDETYTASASSYYSPNSETPYKAFSTLETSATAGSDTNQWTTGTSSYETGGFTGTYSCCRTLVDGMPVAGEWLQMQCTQKHVVGSFSIMANYWNPTRAPRSLVLAGSDDGVVWTVLHSEHDIDQWASKQVKVFDVSIKKAVHFHRLIVTSVHGTQSWLTIDKLRFYENYVSIPNPISTDL